MIELLRRHPSIVYNNMIEMLTGMLGCSTQEQCHTNVSPSKLVTTHNH